MTSAAPTFKAALVTALAALPSLSGVLVTYGAPGRYQPDDIVAVMDIESDSEAATISPNRAREETLSLTVVASCYRGGEDTQQVCTERAYVLIDIVEAYLRTTDPTVGGTVRGLLGPVSYSLEESLSEQGRTSEVTATFTVYARI